MNFRRKSHARSIKKDGEKRRHDIAQSVRAGMRPTDANTRHTDANENLRVLKIQVSVLPCENESNTREVTHASQSSQRVPR